MRHYREMSQSSFCRPFMFDFTNIRRTLKCVLFWSKKQTATPKPLVSIGSDNGLVPSANKPLLEPILTQTYSHLALQGHNDQHMNEINICGSQYKSFFYNIKMIIQDNTFLPSFRRHPMLLHKQFAGSTQGEWFCHVPKVHTNACNCRW